MHGLMTESQPWLSWENGHLHDTRSLFPHCLKLISTICRVLICMISSRRSSGLVSRPLRDLSLSPCVTGRRACWPIRPRSETCEREEQRRGVKITKSFLSQEILYNNINIFQFYSSRFVFFSQHDNKKRKKYILFWSTIILLSYLYFFFSFTETHFH